MKGKPTILILGKLPPPLMGPAIATQIILSSNLKDHFNIIHLDTRINKDVSTMGRWGLNKIFKSINIYFEFIKKVLTHKPQLIIVPISQTTMGFIKDAPFILLGSVMRKKVLIQLRGSNFKNWLKGANKLTHNFVSYCLKKCVGVIVLGNNLKHLFENYFKIDQIHVVPNGANYSLQHRKENELTVLYLANFLPSKSFDDILKAVSILKEKGINNFKLKAAGAWDNKVFKKKCHSIISDNNLNNVEIIPPQSGEDKMQCFADSDIFVFCPKMPEGHPWVIVEAMANGLPIIATDQGAIIESVENEKNGFIVPPESPEMIAQQLEELINNKELREKMSVYSKDKYLSNFTEEKMVSNLKNVIDHLI